MKILNTDRLYLRNLKISDVDNIYDYRNNEMCNKYQRWNDFSKDEIKSFIIKFENDNFLSVKAEQHFAICLEKNDVLVGELAYFYNEEDNCITLGITISYQHQRDGFAFEILTEVIRQIRIQYPSMDIVGLIDKENRKSIKLFEKLGFEQECYEASIFSYVYVLYGK